MAITDLTGCVWVANNNITASNSYTTYNINFSNNNISGSNVKIPLANYDYGKMFSSEVNNDAFYDLCLNSSNQWIIYDNDKGYVVETIGTLEITITGGSDVTNATLIAWLEANGTLTAPQPTANTYTITHNLTNVNKGNITLQLTPDTGYELPDTITVTNGTLVSYDKTTGIAVISGDDNTSVSVECVESVPSGITIKIAGAYEIYQPYYILNGGSETYLPNENITNIRYYTKSDIDAVALTLTNVVSLAVGGEAADTRQVSIYDSNFNEITTKFLPYVESMDITQYLQDNCYVVIYGRD